MGHNSTPAVKLKAILSCPKIVSEIGSNPKSFSNENILTPMNSAKMAFVRKKAPRTRNKRFSFENGLSFFGISVE
jgi:hypothetical protein